MAKREPPWWYSHTPVDRIATCLLLPAGLAYGFIAGRRMIKDPAYRSLFPTIAVGNFTAGGTGKTPFVQVLIKRLRDMGHVPIVLSRGYGGSTRGPHWVSLERDSGSTVGDEPLLLARDAPVMVAQDRAAGARAIEKRAAELHPTVIVMDDGLQNNALAKDLVIAVVDGRRGLGNGHCIPAGPLRAELSVQLGMTDAIVINRGAGDEPLARSASDLIEGFHGDVFSAVVTPDADTRWISGTDIIAFAGIGVPERFFATLRGCGGIVREGVVFADHYVFNDVDAARLLSRAADLGALLVTTEKDYMRLLGAGGEVGRLRETVRTLPIRLVLAHESAGDLSSLLSKRLQKAARPGQTIGTDTQRSKGNSSDD